MARRVCQIFGIGFLFLGIAGFFAPDALGAHLNVANNVVHLLTAAAALYFGFWATVDQAEVFSYIFGTLYGVLGVAGFMLGSPDGRILEVGPLMLGSVDHAIHVLAGSVFMAAAFLTDARFAAEHEHEYAHRRHRHP